VAGSRARRIDKNRGGRIAYITCFGAAAGKTASKIRSFIGPAIRNSARGAAGADQRPCCGDRAEDLTIPATLQSAEGLLMTPRAGLGRTGFSCRVGAEKGGGRF